MDYAKMSPAEVRQLIREGKITTQTSGMCDGYAQGHLLILPMEQAELPKAGVQEQFYRRLWTRFYDTVSIEARYNPKCRMTHMPKRYWGMMTEFQAENRPSALPENGSSHSEKFKKK